jgi:hypothetical protein
LADGAGGAGEGGLGGWCFVDGEVLAVRVFGRLAVESERGQYRLAGHDVTNVKNQDLTPNMRSLTPSTRSLLPAAVAFCGWVAGPWAVWQRIET